MKSRWNEMFACNCTYTVNSNLKQFSPYTMTEYCTITQILSSTVPYYEHDFAITYNSTCISY